MKNQKGITLIALIITIIVMLILVGVTVTTAIDGGLFSKAKQAKREIEKAQWEENITTKLLSMNAELEANDKYELEMNDEEILNIFKILLEDVQDGFELENRYILKASDSDLDFDILNYELLYNEGYMDDNLNPIKIPCKFDGKDVILKYELDINEESGMVKIAEVSFIVNKVSIVAKNDPVEVTVGENIKSLTEDGVPIPKGFYYVTGTKDTGVVISDSATDENNAEGNSGNQYVWVPVNVNPRLEIEIDSETNVEEVKIENTDGYTETINVNSNYYKKTINLTGNAIYLVTVKYEDGTIEEYIREVNKAYSKYNVTYTIVEIFARMQGMTANELIEQQLQDALEENPDCTKIDVLKAENDTKIDNPTEAANVLKYGGFYIGRYEASLTAGIRKSVTPTDSVSYETAISAVETLYTDKQAYGVTADLPSAAAWDAVGGWLLDTGDKTANNIYYSSENWGNYRIKVTNTTYQKKVTGSSEKYKANNIYDLAGNLEEWTKETNGEEGVYITRGGNYGALGLPTFSSKHERGADENATTMEKIGARPILYIND